jgi:outer membrane immunogenic protein
MTSPFTRSVAVVILVAIGFLAWPDNSFAQSNDEALRRLEAKIDALAQENAALRDRVRHLEGAKTSVAAAAPILTSSRSTETRAIPVKGSALTQPVNWSGFYVGGNAGYGWSDPTTTTSNNNYVTAFNSSVFVPLNPGQYTIKNNGGIAGIQAGYNYQISRTVLGIESDFNWSNVNGSANYSAVCSGFLGVLLNCTYSQSQKLDWLVTARGRLGFLVAPETMIYGTGGLAFGHTNVSQSLHSSGFAGTFDATSTNSNTNTGWVVGAGIESMIVPNWMVRLEYMHYDLGTVVSIAPISTAAGPTGTSTETNFRVNGDLARAGLIYKFK